MLFYCLLSLDLCEAAECWPAWLCGSVCGCVGRRRGDLCRRRRRRRRSRQQHPRQAGRRQPDGTGELARSDKRAGYRHVGGEKGLRWGDGGRWDVGTGPKGELTSFASFPSNAISLHPSRPPTHSRPSPIAGPSALPSYRRTWFDCCPGCLPPSAASALTLCSRTSSATRTMARGTSGPSPRQRVGTFSTTTAGCRASPAPERVRCAGPSHNGQRRTSCSRST